MVKKFTNKYYLSLNLKCRDCGIKLNSKNWGLFGYDPVKKNSEKGYCDKCIEIRSRFADDDIYEAMLKIQKIIDDLCLIEKEKKK